MDLGFLELVQTLGLTCLVYHIVNQPVDRLVPTGSVCDLLVNLSSLSLLFLPWFSPSYISFVYWPVLFSEFWNCYYTPDIQSMLSGYIVFVFSVCVCLWVNIYFVSKISQELLYLESWNFVHKTSMTSCIVGKKIRAVRPGPLELFPFVVLAICVWVNIYFVSKISQELLYLESWNLVHMTSMTSCIVGKKIGAVGSGHLELFPCVVLAICVWINIYFVSKISQELLYLESWNFVHMTSMTSCIVGKKIGVMGQGP